MPCCVRIHALALAFALSLCLGLCYGLWFGLCGAELPQEIEDRLGWPGQGSPLLSPHRIDDSLAVNLLRLGNVVQLGLDLSCGHRLGVVL